MRTQSSWCQAPLFKRILGLIKEESFEETTETPRLKLQIPHLEETPLFREECSPLFSNPRSLAPDVRSKIILELAQE